MDSSQQHGYSLYSRILHGTKEVLPKFFFIAVYIVVIVYLMVMFRKQLATKPTDEECQHQDQHYGRFRRQGEMEPETQAFASGLDVSRYYADVV